MRQDRKVRQVSDLLSVESLTRQMRMRSIYSREGTCSSDDDDKNNNQRRQVMSSKPSDRPFCEEFLGARREQKMLDRE